MAALLVAVPAMRRSTGTAVRSVLLVVIAVVVPIAVLMFRQVAALAWLLLTDSQSFLVRGMLVVAGFLLLAALLTRWIKLSLHVAFAALTATALCLLGSPVGYALIAVVAAVFWSRMALARHSIRELLVGVALGVLTGVVLVRF
jgi:signal transduction histidine kinase